MPLVVLAGPAKPERCALPAIQGFLDQGVKGPGWPDQVHCCPVELRGVVRKALRCLACRDVRQDWDALPDSPYGAARGSSIAPLRGGPPPGAARRPPPQGGRCDLSRRRYNPLPPWRPTAASGDCGGGQGGGVRVADKRKPSRAQPDSRESRPGMTRRNESPSASAYRAARRRGDTGRRMAAMRPTAGPRRSEGSELAGAAQEAARRGARASRIWRPSSRRSKGFASSGKSFVSPSSSAAGLA